MQWQAIVDFDGTISFADTTDRILARFAEPGWEAIEEDWVASRIGSRECMERQIALLHVSPDVLDTFVESFEIDWGFVSFVRPACVTPSRSRWSRMVSTAPSVRCCAGPA